MRQECVSGKTLRNKDSNNINRLLEQKLYNMVHATKAWYDRRLHGCEHINTRLLPTTLH